MKKLLLPLLLTLCSTAGLRAQLFVDTSYDIDQMIHGFFDSAGVSISNVSYTGTDASLAFFEGSQSNIGLNAGLLLTTGAASIAVGPNDQESAGISMGVNGTPWLNDLIPGYVTYDAAVVEMDVVPSSGLLSFQFVFGSEEYQEYVNSSFNDLFAFLVTGPGLPQSDSIWVAADTSYLVDQEACWVCVDTFLIQTDTFCWFDPATNLDSCYFYTDTLLQWCGYDPNCVAPIDTVVYPGYWYLSSGGTNIAMVPATNLPVAINTLNQLVNTQYFVDNAGGQTIQYDGFTTPLWANLGVIPGETYHVRIAIADAGDGIFDSGVFLSIESLGGDTMLLVAPDFSDNATSSSTTVAFQNNSLWATKHHWDFGDGATSDEKNPVHEYDQPGSYVVALTVQNWCSSETITQQVQVGISATEEPASAVFQVRPNPANGSFVLDLKQAGEADVRLYGFDGRLLLDDHLADGARVDLAAYGQGIFLLQVVADGKVYSERVINR